MTTKEFAEGWTHFCNSIDFNQSALDADAIKFMNEMPAAVVEGLTAEPTPAEPEPAAEPEQQSDKAKTDAAARRTAGNSPW